MAEHRADPLSFLLGLLALLTGGLYLLDRAGTVRVDVPAALATLVVALALIGLGRAVVGLRRRLR